MIYKRFGTSDTKNITNTINEKICIFRSRFGKKAKTILGKNRQKYENVDQTILYDVVGTSFDNIVSK